MAIDRRPKIIDSVDKIEDEIFIDALIPNLVYKTIEFSDVSDFTITGDSRYDYLIIKTTNQDDFEIFKNIEAPDLGFSIISEELLNTSTTRTVRFAYTQKEGNRLTELFGGQTPEIQFNLDDTKGVSSIGAQNFVTGEEISYQSLSSLGEIAEESITISATTGSVTGLIIEQSETITDVGGVVARGRRDAAGNVTTTVTTGGSTTTTTVTTSGY